MTEISYCLDIKKMFVKVALKKYIGNYQTSSPSYLFMAGMDECIANLEKEGNHLWDAFFEMRGDFLKKMAILQNIRIFQDNDPCKLVISVKGTSMSGNELQKILLEKYHIQLEMAAETYVLGIITMCDTKEGFDRLAEALLEIDGRIDSEDAINSPYGWDECEEVIVYSLAEVREKDTKEILIETAEGRVCADYVNLYPPGIPLLLPGERIRREHIALINRYLEKDMHVQGVTDNRILVC